MSKPKPIRAHKRKPPKATKREATILEFDVWTSRSRGFPLKPDRRFWQIVRLYPPSPKTEGRWFMMVAWKHSVAPTLVQVGDLRILPASSPWPPKGAETAERRFRQRRIDREEE